jgi:hypothetical protein
MFKNIAFESMSMSKNRSEESFPTAFTLFIVLAIVLGGATLLLKHKK